MITAGDVVVILLVGAAFLACVFVLGTIWLRDYAHE